MHRRHVFGAQALGGGKGAAGRAVGTRGEGSSPGAPSVPARPDFATPPAPHTHAHTEEPGASEEGNRRLPP